MMLKTIYPKTKDELIAAIKSTKIDKIEILDPADKKTSQLIGSSNRPSIKRWVIIIDERF